MYRIDPLIPSTFSAANPSTQNPRCDTDEYATSFLISCCTHATSAPYMIPTTQSVPTIPSTVGLLPNPTGSANRNIPYVPSFSSTPARITDPAVGASVCASGSHGSTGNSGTFTAQPATNPILL